METEQDLFDENARRTTPEGLPELLEEAARDLDDAWKDDSFRKALDVHLHRFAGRPTPLFPAATLTRKLGGARIYLKREDLAHTGSHRICETLALAHLARRRGKRRLLALHADWHQSLAAASAAALLGLGCTLYMKEQDASSLPRGLKILHEFRTRIQTAPDPAEALLQDLLQDRLEGTHEACLLPAPEQTARYGIGKRLQEAAAREITRQMMELEGRAPDVLIASAEEGSGLLEACADLFGKHDTRILRVRGPGSGGDQSVEDYEAAHARNRLARHEGILPSLESARALALAMRIAPTLSREAAIVVLISAPGPDEDLENNLQEEHH